MKSAVKVLLAVVSLLILFVVAAVILIPTFVDPNDYKPQIHAAIERQLGRKVDISGDIELSVFPWFGIELGRVEVANAKGFSDKPMATMRSAELSVKLLPLLSRNVEVGMISLDGLRLRLARDKSGRTNWGDIAEHMANSEPDAPADIGVPEQPTGESGLGLSSLQVEAVSIEDASVSWQDAATGTQYRASDVSFSTGRLTDGTPVRIESSGRLAAPRWRINGDVDVVMRIKPDFANHFYRFSDLRLSLIANGDAVPGGRQQAHLSGHGKLDMASGRIELSGLMLQAAGLNVTGHVDVSSLKGAPLYSGRVTVKEFDPKAVMAELGIEPPATQSDDVLSSATFDAGFDATGGSLHLRQMRVTLDDSTLKGIIRVGNFSQPAIGFNLGLDQIDIDDYLPPDSAAKAGGGQEQEKAEIDLSPLKNLRLDGKLAAGSLTVANVHMTDANLEVKARNGVLTIESLMANLYQGNMQLTAKIDASHDRPRYALKGDLSGMQLEPLLQDLAGTGRLAALANMNVDVTAAGKQVAAMKRAINGSFGFDLRDGAINGFSLAKIIAAARRGISGEDVDFGADVANGERTPFNHLAAHFNINDGVMAGRDLRFTSKRVDASGAGHYDLARNVLDYRIKAEVPEEASGPLEKLAGVTIPIQLTGNLLSPDYSLDVASALRSVASKRLREEKSQLQNKLREKLRKRSQDTGDKLNNQIQKGVEGLFGNGKKQERSN